MKLNALFSDGAIFQRRKVIPVFGWTDPQSKVEISFAGNQYYGMAGADGYFLIRMKEVEAGGPYTMTLRNTRTGDTAVVSDILVGEVWLASGQSNMQFAMYESAAQMAEFRKEFTKKNKIRMLTVPLKASSAPENFVTGIPSYNGNVVTDDVPVWLDAADDCSRMSAVALWFAKKLHDDLQVPVGILSSSWGGTIAEAWTSQEMLRTNPDMALKLMEYQEELSRPERWKKITDEEPLLNVNSASEQILFEKYCTLNPADEGFGKGWAEIDFDDSSWENFSIPGSWIEKKLCGNGVIWIRRSVTLPESWAGRDLELHLGGIDKQDSSYFNGEKIGSTGEGFDTKYWNTLRNYPIPGRLVKAGKNMVSVRAYSFIYDGAFTGLQSDYYLCPADAPDERISLTGPCSFNVEHDFHFAGMPGGNLAMGPHTPNSYGILFDSMIRPLIPYAIQGAIWYQGCSNAHSVADSVKYERLMTDLIRDWRFRWGQGDFPFIQTCLAGFTTEFDYTDDCTWGPLRNSQRLSTQKNPNCGLASAVDVGEVLNIHPADKRTVGTRMALWALENTYYVPGVNGTSPEVKALYREAPGVLRLTFDHCANSLVAKNGKLTGFYVTDGDDYIPAAEAYLEGNSVVLKCPEKPMAHKVRYAWSQNPMGVLSLYNSAGLPATPFEIALS